jgi:hypothetical protein
LRLQNSYIHDQAQGLLFYMDHSVQGQLLATNNTFYKNANGMRLGYYDAHNGAIGFYNNLLVQSTSTAVESTGNNSPPFSFGNNLLFGNMINYAGTASDGPNYVKADPLLDTSYMPPRLKPGSPGRNVGDGVYAPTNDYWGLPRPPPGDIGAVQSP